jgi:hypothetical protein
MAEFGSEQIFTKHCLTVEALIRDLVIEDGDLLKTTNKSTNDCDDDDLNSDDLKDTDDGADEVMMD